MPANRALVLATRNRGKVGELKDLLKGLNLEIRTLDDYPGVPPVSEDGATFEENAVLKAEFVARATGEVAMADDSGLEVDALGGRPGVWSARYAGPEATDAANNRKLLGELEGVPAQRRDARFVSSVAIAVPGGPTTTARGECAGRIGFEPRGDKGFGYDPLFYLEDGRSFAELDMDEKNRISHRGQAFRQAREKLRELFGE